jgi:hypothetical protein
MRLELRAAFGILLFGGVMSRNHSEEESSLLRMELKYCEHCGGLWMRECGAGVVYCENCQPKVADLPLPKKKPSRVPKIPVRDPLSWRSTGSRVGTTATWSLRPRRLEVWHERRDWMVGGGGGKWGGSRTLGPAGRRMHRAKRDDRTVPGIERRESKFPLLAKPAKNGAPGIERGESKSKAPLPAKRNIKGRPFLE